MSNWSHVAGIIRVDSIRFFDHDMDFDKLIGRECLFSSPSEVWDEAFDHPERFLPMGSEGSLQKEVWDNPDKACIAAYTISIFGDLRDHDYPKQVVDWFKEICKKLAVRNAVIVVDNEENGQVSWAYQGDWSV